MQAKRDELASLRNNLTLKTNEYGKLVLDVPPFERAYQEAMATEVFRMRADGVPIGVIDKTIRGKKPVSDLRFDRDLKRAMRDACKETIKAIQSSINALQTEINSEIKEHELAGSWQV